MRQAHATFKSHGAKVVTVSAKSAAMAATLQADMPFPLLIDPDNTFRRAMNIDKLTVGQAMGIRSLTNYAKSLGGVRNMTVQISEATQTPIVIVFDADQAEVWRHVGVALGDYPPVDEVIANLPTT